MGCLTQPKLNVQNVIQYSRIKQTLNLENTLWFVVAYGWWDFSQRLLFYLDTFKDINHKSSICSNSVGVK